MGEQGQGPSRAEPERSVALELADLLARVEAAEGPDRYADCWIACAFDGFFPVPKQWPELSGEMVWRVDFCRFQDGGLVSPGHGGDQMVRGYTASLDAALALVERVLPGWAWNISGADPEGCSEHLSYAELAGKVQLVKWGWDEPPEPSRDTHGAHAKTPALALIASLLKALQAQPDRHDARDGARTQTSDPT